MWSRFPRNVYGERRSNSRAPAMPSAAIIPSCLLGRVRFRSSSPPLGIGRIFGCSSPRQRSRRSESWSARSGTQYLLYGNSDLVSTSELHQHPSSNLCDLATLVEFCDLLSHRLSTEPTSCSITKTVQDYSGSDKQRRENAFARLRFEKKLSSLQQNPRHVMHAYDAICPRASSEARRVGLISSDTFGTCFLEQFVLHVISAN